MTRMDTDRVLKAIFRSVLVEQRGRNVQLLDDNIDNDTETMGLSRGELMDTSLERIQWQRTGEHACPGPGVQ